MVTLTNIEEAIISIQNEKVLLDSDVARLYDVETRDINKAVKNNPRKFPEGYIIVLSRDEKNDLVENFHRFEKLKHSIVLPKAFTEKGLYMLATILKSDKASETSIGIIEAFTKLRHLNRNIHALAKTNACQTIKTDRSSPVPTGPCRLFQDRSSPVPTAQCQYDGRPVKPGLYLSSASLCE